jgi:hypothetical protein
VGGDVPEARREWEPSASTDPSADPSAALLRRAIAHVETLLGRLEPHAPVEWRSSWLVPPIEPVPEPRAAALSPAPTARTFEPFIAVPPPTAMTAIPAAGSADSTAAANSRAAEIDQEISSVAAAEALRLVLRAQEDARRVRTEAAVESERLLREARQLADRVVAEGRARAEALVAQAHAEAAELVDATRDGADAVERTLADTVADLQVRLLAYRDALRRVESGGRSGADDHGR